MKGIIVSSMRECFVKQYGEEARNEVLEKAGVRTHKIILDSVDFNDEDLVKIIDAIVEKTNKKREVLLREFGKYFITIKSQEIYKQFYRKHSDAKSFLLDMDKVHTQLTNTIQGAKPPKFTYQEKDDKTIVMEYESHRDMIDYMIGAIEGVGEVYNQKLDIRKIDNKSVEIRFL